MFKADSLLYNSSLGSKLIKKKKKFGVELHGLRARVQHVGFIIHLIVVLLEDGGWLFVWDPEFQTNLLFCVWFWGFGVEVQALGAWMKR